MTYVPNLSAEGLLRHDDERFTDDDVRIIIDVDTQERIPHGLSSICPTNKMTVVF